MPPPPKILVVDDQADFRAMLQLALQSAGFELSFAEHGLAALERMATDPPHLVLLDMRMPQMDGTELLRRMRSSGIASRIPVIFLTGSLLNADELSKILDLDPADVITKSVSARELIARIHWVLRRSNHRPAA